MYVLGIGCYYHDSSACLIKDGKLLSAVQEERFTRKKHDSNFPNNAIKYCLKNARIKMKDVDYVAFYEKPLLKFERIIRQHASNYPKSIGVFARNMGSWIREKLQVQKRIRKEGFKGEIFFIEHHLAHSGAFFMSPFQRAAIVNIDGVGEKTTTSFGLGKDNRIEIRGEIHFPDSIGLLYSTITAYLGFRVNNSEYKVMGLSAYGDKSTNNIYYEKLKQVINIRKDGSFKLDRRYFCYEHTDKMPSKLLCSLLGGKIRKKGEPILKRHMNVAAAVQMITEEAVINILNHAYDEIRSPNLVFSGGVALNCVANGEILNKTKFKKVWIQPDPGDGGSSVGAAYFAYNSILGKKRNFVFDSPFLGPRYEVKEFLDRNEVKYKKIKNLGEVAELIKQGNVIGWYEGRMEYGPRALGNRSILANPMMKDMKDIINLKIKRRENFRPFAPVVCKDDFKRYFEDQFQDPMKYMLMACKVKSKKIPAVTHIDGTARVQIVNKSRLYRLIKEFGKKTGVNVLLNTSFNVRGEPIVCSPLDAYGCMLNTNIDYIVMDDYIISREENI